MDLSRDIFRTKVDDDQGLNDIGIRILGREVIDEETDLTAMLDKD